MVHRIDDGDFSIYRNPLRGAWAMVLVWVLLAFLQVRGCDQRNLAAPSRCIKNGAREAWQTYPGSGSPHTADLMGQTRSESSTRTGAGSRSASGV